MMDVSGSKSLEVKREEEDPGSPHVDVVKASLI
jgi:hypothetical protein